MKAVLIYLAMVFLFVPMAIGEEVSLAWDPNTEKNLAGYKIYYGTESGNYSHSVDVGNVTLYTLKGLQECITYYLAATAYDTEDNESAFSKELVYTPEYLKPNTTSGLGYKPLSIRW